MTIRCHQCLKRNDRAYLPNRMKINGKPAPITPLCSKCLAKRNALAFKRMADDAGISLSETARLAFP